MPEKHRMLIQSNVYSSRTMRVIDLCNDHISPLTLVDKRGFAYQYGGDGWKVFMENNDWYLEVDDERHLMYIKLAL